MNRQSKPPAYLVATTKLQHEWSANRGVPHISADWLDELLDDHRFGDINSMVKIRLLLAGLLALDSAPLAAAAARENGQHAAELHQALQRLRTAVGADSDEWDKVMAAAAGPMDGRLDLDAVMQQSQAVQESMTGLRQQVAASTNQHLFTPREADFLQDPPSVLDLDAHDFVVQDNPRVLALSGGYSYTQATPPPPSLLRAQGVRHAPARGAGAAGGHTAAGTAPHRPPQARPQQAGPAVGLSRAKSGALERSHTVQLLPEEEQANLFKVTHMKHGVASAVKGEQLPYEKPAKPPKQAEQQQQQQQRPHGQRSSINAGAAAAQDASDEDIDALFDDEEEGWDVERSGPAATGVSRSTRHHLHHRQHSGQWGEEEGREATPEDLVDDLEVQEGGEGDEGQMDLMDEGGVEVEDIPAAGVREGDSGGVAEQQQSAATKRRRVHVIASDSEDDD